MSIKTVYSEVSVASDGAELTGRSDRNSSREFADTTRKFVPVSVCPWEEGIEVGRVVDSLRKKNFTVPIVRLCWHV